MGFPQIHDLCSRKMCILFAYSGAFEETDYSYILASNRDEFYVRPSQQMASWEEDPLSYGGRDLEPGCDQGTWLAISPLRNKIGVLLNIPRVNADSVKSRGIIVADFVKGEMATSDYVNSKKNYFKQCHDFVFVSIELGNVPVTQTYCSVTDKLQKWTETSLAFGNCLPEQPLQKVIDAKIKMKEICTRFNKIEQKTELVDELLKLLKSKERHLPDPQLQKSRPNLYEELSSVFVEIPDKQYGTRTHSLILVTKSGHIDVIELTLKSPLDLSDENWQRTEFQFDI